MAYDSVLGGAEAERLAGRTIKAASGFRPVAVQFWLRNVSDSWQGFDYYNNSPQFSDSKGGSSSAELALPLGYVAYYDPGPWGFEIPPQGSIWVVVYGQVPTERQVEAVTFTPQNRQGMLGRVTPQPGGVQRALFLPDGAGRLTTRSLVQCAGHATLSGGARLNDDASVSVLVTVRNDSSETQSASALVYSAHMWLYQLNGAFGEFGDGAFGEYGHVGAGFAPGSLPPDQNGSQTLTLKPGKNAVTNFTPPYVLFSRVTFGGPSKGTMCIDYLALNVS
ncbi:MAG: hypothetical protein Q7R39_18525 [Dehalococcoidia bacterium]|nr:hypothetical protein [Dehalococcoidia bacterium]